MSEKSHTPEEQENDRTMKKPKPSYHLLKCPAAPSNPAEGECTCNDRPITPPRMPEPTPEEIAEWTRRSEHAKAHPETLVPFDEMVKRLSSPSPLLERTRKE